jgi:DNA polymerase-1
MPKKLFLVDGSNQAFRAYFAIMGDMRSADGFPTKALFGFASMIQRISRELKPDYLIVVFDRGLSFRNELYPDYKGQRPDMPEDLRLQWPEFEPFCEEWGIKASSIVGFEADDIIGTLAVRYASPEVHVRIVSSDKDFCQLVNEHIHVLDLAKDEVLDPAKVVEKWGVPADKIIDLLSLMGDSSDNVPGVAGVGEKKAAKFIQTYGSAEAVLDNASKIGGKTGETLAASREIVALARQLVTIHKDVPLSFGLEDLAPRRPDYPALEARLKRYNFKRMLTAVQAELGADAVVSAGLDRSKYRSITSPEALAELVSTLRAAGRFAYDSETTSLDPQKAEIVGMSFSWSADFGVYVPIGHLPGPSGAPPNCPGALEALAPLLADPTLKKTGQNLKYDLSVLRARGLELAGIDGDTMIADYLLDVDRKHGLDELALRYLDHKMIAFKDVTALFDGEFCRVSVDRATEYAAEDAHVAWLLDEKLVLGPLDTLYRTIELPLIPVLADMELKGIRVDVPALQALSKELEGRLQIAIEAVYAEAGETFNLNSTQQLAVILFEKRGLAAGKKTKTGYSTDADTLDKLAAEGDKLCQLMLDYRELAKLKSTYVDALPKTVSTLDQRIHSSFHQAVAATGRLSSNEPNLQNIPIRTPEGRRIRACFIPDPGYRFVSADYSQIELRVLAHFCGEGPLVEAFKTGQDIHRRTAAEIFGVAPALVSAEQRRAAKAINFGIVYGMSAFRLGNDLRISRKVAQEYIDGYFARYPQVKAYMERAIEQAKSRGYAETLFGRRRPVRGLDARSPVDRGAAERIAINTPVQGTAADLIKLAMIRVHERLRADFPQSRLLLQVHDELVLEVPEADVSAVREAVAAEMAAVAELIVPLVADTGVGDTWDAAH